MNEKKKIVLRNVNVDEPQLSSVILFSIGHPSQQKVQAVIESYHNTQHKIIGAFIGDILVGIVGLLKIHESIIIRHLSVVPRWRKQGIGTLLLKGVKRCYPHISVVAETDDESVQFYLQLGFACHSFTGPYGTLRYKCTINKSDIPTS